MTDGIREPAQSSLPDKKTSPRQPAREHASPRHSRFSEVAKHYARALPLLIILTALGQYFERIGLFDSMNNVFLDTFPQTRPPQMVDGILILEISNDDYKTYFGSKSPLDPDTVAQLVNTISSAHPAVIGVDLDTSDPPWCAYLNSVPDVKNNLSDNRIVWAEVPQTVQSPLDLRPVLGGTFGAWNQVGIPRFSLGRDGVVRRFAREFAVTTAALPGCPDTKPPEPSAATMSSLSAVIVEKWCTQKPPPVPGKFGLVCKDPPLPSKRTDDEVIFNLAGDRYHMLISDARDFMLPPKPDPHVPLTAKELKATDDERKQAWTDIQARLQLLENKIVLIGGDYQAARDTYFTPVGEKAGVELVAEAVLADLGAGAVNPVTGFYAIAVDVLIGSIVILLYFYLYDWPRVALLASLALIPLLLLFGGPWLSRTGYWLDVSTVIVGLVLDQVFELSGRIGEYQEERATLEAELQELRWQTRSSPGRTSQRAEQVVHEEQPLQATQTAAQKQTEAIVLISATDSPAANVRAELPDDPPSSEKAT